MWYALPPPAPWEEAMRILLMSYHRQYRRHRRLHCFAPKRRAAFRGITRVKERALLAVFPAFRGARRDFALYSQLRNFDGFLPATLPQRVAIHPIEVEASPRASATRDVLDGHPRPATHIRVPQALLEMALLCRRRQADAALEAN